MMKCISYIIPLYNESAVTKQLYTTLTSVISTLPYEAEIIFVNDGSTDTSAAVLIELSKADPRVKAIEFTRNFGKEMALTAGLEVATGDACLMLDADMQHPIERIPDFVRAWEAGSLVVVGVRARGAYTSFVHRLASRTFYTLMRWVGDTPLTPNATDFRLLDRQVVTVFLQCREKHRITRGLIEWLGFATTFIEFTAPPRSAGTTAYSWNKRFSLAANALVSHSFLPLRLVGYMGAFIIIISTPLGLSMFVEEYVLHDPWQLHITGTSMLAMFILFLIGIVLAAIGLMSLYIAAIHTEVTNRPLYVVKKKINID